MEENRGFEVWWSLMGKWQVSTTFMVLAIFFGALSITSNNKIFSIAIGVVALIIVIVAVIICATKTTVIDNNIVACVGAIASLATWSALSVSTIIIANTYAIATITTYLAMLVPVVGAVAITSIATITQKNVNKGSACLSYAAEFIVILLLALGLMRSL